MHDTHFLVDLPMPDMQIRKPAESFWNRSMEIGAPTLVTQDC